MSIDDKTMSCWTETQVRQVWSDGNSVILDKRDGNAIAELEVLKSKIAKEDDNNVSVWVCEKCGEMTDMIWNVCCHCGARKPKGI